MFFLGVLAGREIKNYWGKIWVPTPASIDSLEVQKGHPNNTIDCVMLLLKSACLAICPLAR